MGYVAATNRVSGADAATIDAGGQRVSLQSSRLRLLVFRPPIALLFVFSLVFAVPGQSGRRKSEQAKTPSPVDATQAPPAAKNSGSTSSPEKKDQARKPRDEIDSTEVLRISSNLVPVPASVVDLRGFALTNLKLEDFELRIDGQIKTISELSRSDTPVRLALLFDNSGSLLASREIEKQAASRFFRHVLRPYDQAAIYSVATDVYLAQALTKDIRKLEQTIDSFGKPEGGTSLLDGIVEAAVYLKAYNGRKVIVIVSDGADTTSRFDFETTLQKVLSEDCEVYVVQTGLYENANLRDLTAERRMELLTAQTGGAVYIPKETADLETAFGQIAADLAQQYVLSYYAVDERRDGQFHSIALSVKTRRDTRVRARRGFYAPRA
jgi:Ca-activated chloride channel family protein